MDRHELLAGIRGRNARIDELVAENERLKDSLRECAAERDMRDAALDDAYAFIQRRRRRWDAFMRWLGERRVTHHPAPHPQDREAG